MFRIFCMFVSLYAHNIFEIQKKNIISRWKQAFCCNNTIPNTSHYMVHKICNVKCAPEEHELIKYLSDYAFIVNSHI